MQGITIQGKITRNGILLTKAEVCVDNLQNCVFSQYGNFTIQNIRGGNHTMIVRKNNVTIYQENVIVRREKFNVMTHHIIISVTSASPSSIPKVNLSES